MRNWLKSLKMCQNFSESVSRILSQVEGRGGEQTAVRSYAGGATRPFTVLVEGNIGSGKTTYLQHFSGSRHQDKVEVVMEPVEKWRNLNSHNLLQMMYEDPSRWSLTFQTYVQLTMLQNHTQPCDRPLKMMERSLYSAKFCFAENLRRTGRMPQSEYEVLSGWFDFMLQCPDIDLGADLIVYLRTDPEVALRRVRGRRRGEEHLISEAYIRDLHTLHEDWLMQHKERFPVPAPVLVVDANKDIADMRQLFETISAEIVDQSDKDKLPEEVVEDKENTPEKSMGTKRSCDQKENVERSKKQSVLSNVN